MAQLWFNMSMLALESQRAIWLRLLKLSAGGPKARRVQRRVSPPPSEVGRIPRQDSSPTAARL